MQSCSEAALVQACNRRLFLGAATVNLGAAALAAGVDRTSPAFVQPSLHRPRAKRVIYLFQSGAPSQIDLFDYKPRVRGRTGEELPDEIRMGQRLTTMTSGQDRFPLAPSPFRFSRHGESGGWFSELVPHMASLSDDICMIRSMTTEAINHDPAVTFFQTGSQLAGRPSAGAWVSYGLGTLNENLPTFVVLLSRGRDGQPLYNRLWGSGFLPAEHQGVQLRSGKDPVLYLSSPPGSDRAMRRSMLDDIAKLNLQQHSRSGDPETLARIQQYELAFRMQSSVPDLTDISDEPKHVLDMYGPAVHTPGSYARNCLLARRMAERDVRFIQLYHMGWDQHGNLEKDIRLMCESSDQPTAALVKDLKQRGLLDDTLVIWGGEFGRTVYSQGDISKPGYGRDHHPRCFTVWLAGAGINPGLQHGTTDDFSYNITSNPVEVYDLNATMLYLLGVDHKRLTYRSQGRDFRLTDVHGRVIHAILS